MRPKELRPSVLPCGRCPVPVPEEPRGRSYTDQCTNTPPGAFWSSTSSASDRARAGTRVHVSGGAVSSPSHVYRDGMLEPLRNAELESPIVEGVGRGPLAVVPPPAPQPARAPNSGVRSRAAAIAIGRTSPSAYDGGRGPAQRSQWRY